MTTVTAYPASAGAATALTPVPSAPNWDCVNDAAVTTDYVCIMADSGVAVSGTDYYNFADSLVPSGAIVSDVIVWAYCKKTSALVGQVTLVLRSGASSSVGATQTLTTSWAWYHEHWAINPFTGVAWVAADFDPLQMGLILYCDRDRFTVGLSSFCASMYIEVYYTLAAGGVLRRLLVGVGL